MQLADARRKSQLLMTEEDKPGLELLRLKLMQGKSV